MRKHLVSTVMALMKKDSNVFFLTGDLGFGSFEVIQQTYPDRFFNMGIAEQNMIGVACGLCLSGKKVIIYSISNFATLRVMEQIRNYLTYHDCHVLIVAGSGGFSYGQLGYTHHAIEDISMMKSIPQMHVYAPSNGASVEQAMSKWYAISQTAYLRLEKNEAVLPEPTIQYDFGNLYGEAEAKNFIITYGTIAEEAIQVQQSLKEKDMPLAIIVLNELKIKADKLYELVNHAERVLFLEENVINGGVGEHFFSTCMIKNIQIGQAKIAGVKDVISNTNGSQSYLRCVHELKSVDIIKFFWI